MGELLFKFFVALAGEVDLFFCHGFSLDFELVRKAGGGSLMSKRLRGCLSAGRSRHIIVTAVQTVKSAPEWRLSDAEATSIIGPLDRQATSGRPSARTGGRWGHRARQRHAHALDWAPPADHSRCCAHCHRPCRA